MCERRGHQDADCHCTGGLAEDGDIVRIAAKAGDIGFDPAQRCELILQAVIARRRFRIEIGMGEKAEDTQAIVEADDDDEDGADETDEEPAVVREPDE